jgi:hypothetical protein
MDLVPQARSSGPAADQHELHAALRVLHRVDHERLTLQGLEPARVEHVVAVVAGLHREHRGGRRRRVVQRLGRDLEAVPQALGHVLRVGEDPLGLAERQAVAGVDQVANRRAVLLHREVAEVGMVPELVGRAVLVDQPHDLAVVRREVRRELQRDHGVDAHPVGLGDVERTPHRHLVHDLRREVPLARDRHDLGVVPRIAQRLRERLGVDLGAAADERGLGIEHRDPHGASPPPCRRSPTCCCSSPPGARARGPAPRARPTDPWHRRAGGRSGASRTGRRGTRRTSPSDEAGSARRGAAPRAAWPLVRRSASSRRTRASARAPGACPPAAWPRPPGSNRGGRTSER